MISPEEESDIIILRDAILKEKLSTFDYILHLTKYGIEHSGHKTLGEALVYSVKRADVNINKLTRKHTDKYPD